MGKTISQEAISGVQKLKVLPLWGNLHGNRGLLATKMPPSIGMHREVANSLFHLLQQEQIPQALHCILYVFVP